MLGELELAEGRQKAASAHWLKAVEIARENSDRYVQFKADFQLFRLAIENRNATVLNSLGRRLSRLVPWIRSSEPDVAEFRRLYALHRKPKQRGVAHTQHSGSR
jgi:hypothetical protein